MYNNNITPLISERDTGKVVTSSVHTDPIHANHSFKVDSKEGDHLSTSSHAAIDRLVSAKETSATTASEAGEESPAVRMDLESDEKNDYWAAANVDESRQSGNSTENSDAEDGDDGDDENESTNANDDADQQEAAAAAAAAEEEVITSRSGRKRKATAFYDPSAIKSKREIENAVRKRTTKKGARSGGMKGDSLLTLSSGGKRSAPKLSKYPLDVQRRVKKNLEKEKVLLAELADLER